MNLGTGIWPLYLPGIGNHKLEAPRRQGVSRVGCHSLPHSFVLVLCLNVPIQATQPAFGLQFEELPNKRILQKEIVADTGPMGEDQRVLDLVVKPLGYSGCKIQKTSPEEKRQLLLHQHSGQAWGSVRPHPLFSVYVL